MKTATEPVVDMFAIYDRIYDIADRLFKKYNPCKIHTINGKTKCINKNYKRNYLCCQHYSKRCEHWQDRCKVKCLSCKLFVCGNILYDEKQSIFLKRLHRLHKIASRHRLSAFDYYKTKKSVLNQWRYYNGNKRTLQSRKSRCTQKKETQRSRCTA